MKYIIILFLVSQVHSFANAQPASATPEKYDVVVSFGSMCCGTVSDDFLADFIKQFNCKNKVTIQGLQLSGCGREGEFKILFLLNKLNTSAKKKLITGLKKLVLIKIIKIRVQTAVNIINTEYPIAFIPACFF